MTIEVQHFKETSELSDSLGSGTGLEICDAFRERLGTLGDFLWTRNNILGRGKQIWGGGGSAGYRLF
jgi:hypothetical protein